MAAERDYQKTAIRTQDPAVVSNFLSQLQKLSSSTTPIYTWINSSATDGYIGHERLLGKPYHRRRRALLLKEFNELLFPLQSSSPAIPNLRRLRPAWASSLSSPLTHTGQQFSPIDSLTTASWTAQTLRPCPSTTSSHLSLHSTLSPLLLPLAPTNDASDDPSDEPGSANNKRPNESVDQSTDAAGANSRPIKQPRKATGNRPDKGKGKGKAANRDEKPNVCPGDPYNLACYFPKLSKDHYPYCAHLTFKTEYDIRADHLWLHVRRGQITLEQYLHLRETATPRDGLRPQQTAAWQQGFVYLFEAFRFQQTKLDPRWNAPMLNWPELERALVHEQLDVPASEWQYARMDDRRLVLYGPGKLLDPNGDLVDTLAFEDDARQFPQIGGPPPDPTSTSDLPRPGDLSGSNGPSSSSARIDSNEGGRPPTSSSLPGGSY